MYSAQRTKARNDTLSYRIYVTDSLQNSPQGKYMASRWADIITPHEDIDVEATIDRVIRELEV